MPGAAEAAGQRQDVPLGPPGLEVREEVGDLQVAPLRIELPNYIPYSAADVRPRAGPRRASELFEHRETGSCYNELA